MIRELSHTDAKYALTICELGLKNQRLLSGCLDYGLLHEAKRLQQIDRELSTLLFGIKQTESLSNEEQQEAGHTHYIWHTQGDNRVRGTHAANEGRLFAWNNSPATGHPGEDYNCRCWAEPYVRGKTEYVEQILGAIFIQGSVSYRYDDTFTDPASIREIIRGSSEPLDASILELLLTDAYGVFYDIIGRWQTTFSAEVKLDASESAF